jgi:hypothetical protein
MSPRQVDDKPDVISVPNTPTLTKKQPPRVRGKAPARNLQKKPLNATKKGAIKGRTKETNRPAVDSSKRVYTTKKNEKGPVQEDQEDHETQAELDRRYPRRNKVTNTRYLD